MHWRILLNGEHGHSLHVVLVREWWLCEMLDCFKNFLLLYKRSKNFHDMVETSVSKSNNQRISQILNSKTHLDTFPMKLNDRNKIFRYCYSPKIVNIFRFLSQLVEIHKKFSRIEWKYFPCLRIPKNFTWNIYAMSVDGLTKNSPFHGGVIRCVGP